VRFGKALFPKDLARRFAPSLPIWLFWRSWRSRSVMWQLFCSVVSRSTRTTADGMEFQPSVSFCRDVFRVPCVRARVEAPSSPKQQSERSMFSTVELLPSPPAMQSTAPGFLPNSFPYKSSVGMVMLQRTLSRSNLADLILSKSLHDISSTSMDVLSYNAGATSANPALPRLLHIKLRLCKLRFFRNALHSILASSRPR
jgi:hypothetical protein